MDLPFQQISTQYQVRRITEEDLPELLSLAQGNPTYYEHMHERPELETLREDLTKLPPRTTPEDKYFLGFYREDRLCAVLDLILHYPNPETAFIGWFILRKDLQGRGVGSAILHELLFHLPFRYIRLGYVKGNRESERFWKKHHFAPTGVEPAGDGYTRVVMQLGRGDTHTFGIMDQPPQPGWDYGDYAPENYVCAWVEDDLLNQAGEALSEIDVYWDSLDRPGKGLAWYGVTLIPPAAIFPLLAAVGGRTDFQELTKLLERAKAENKFIIHFGI